MDLRNEKNHSETDNNKLLVIFGLLNGLVVDLLAELHFGVRFLLAGFRK
jgi:hypothetical protein